MDENQEKIRRVRFVIPEGMRIGQFIHNALRYEGYLAPEEGVQLFYLTDYKLKKALRNEAKRLGVWVVETERANKYRKINES